MKNLIIGSSVVVLVFAVSIQPSYSSSQTLEATSGGTGIVYSLETSDILNQTSPDGSCSNVFQVIVTTPDSSLPSGGERRYYGTIRVALYSKLGVLMSGSSERFENATQNYLMVEFPGCKGAGSTWRNHTWEVKVISNNGIVIVTNWGGVTSWFEEETVSLGIISSPANRPKPKVLLASVLPSSKTANVVLGTNAKFGDPKFQYSYQVTPESSKPSSTKWKKSSEKVFVVTGLRSKFKYALHTRAISFDGVVGTTKTTKFKTK